MWFWGLVACGQSGVDDQTIPSSTTSTTPPTATTLPTATTGALGVSYRVHETLPTLVYATWKQPQQADVHVEYSFDPGVWLSSPMRALGAGAHEEVLLGVPYASTVTFRVVAVDEAGASTSDDVAVTTADLPQLLAPTQILANDPALVDAAGAPYLWTALGFDGGATFACIIDRQGRFVWAKRLPSNRTSLHPRVARDGRSLYLDYNSYWQIFDGGDGATIEQLLVDGTVLQTFDTPGMHHPFTDLPDGSLAYGESVGFYANEYLTVLHPDGSSERLWDCDAWLASIGASSYCSSNTLNYEKGTNKYLYSFWSNETIVEIDGTTAEVERWFGHLDGAYAFDPVQSTFWWQHGGYLTDAGTLLTSSDRTTNGFETVIREYEIDSTTQTLKEIWSFGEDEGVYGYQMGEPHRLPNGNTLHNYGELPRLREVTPAGEVVWDIQWDAGFIGRSMPLVDLYALAPDRL